MGVNDSINGVCTVKQANEFDACCGSGGIYADFDIFSSCTIGK